MSFARVIGVSAVFTFSANRAINQMTRASRGFDRLNTSARNTQDTLRQGFAGMNTIGVAATAGLGLAVSKFAEFDKAAMQLKSRLDASDPSFETMKQKALEVGGATKFTAAEVLTAMERFKQLGVSGKDVLTNIGMVAKFAASENISLEKAVRMGVVSTKVFGLETSKLSDVMNRMMFVSNSTAANTTELFNALRYVSGATKFTKSNFQEVVNLLGLFHNSALFGSRAGTAMTNMLNKLSANAKQGTIQIGDYTAMIHKNNDGGLDITQTMLNVATAFKRMTEDAKKSGKGLETVQRLADKLFGVRGARGVGALIDFVYGKDRNTLLKLYKTQESEVNKEIDKVYNIRVKNVKDAYIRMTSALDAFAIAAVKNFKGPIYSGIERFTAQITNAGKIVDYFTKDFNRLSMGAREVAKVLDPTGKFGISPRMVANVNGFLQGLLGVAAIAKEIGTGFGLVHSFLIDVSRALGGSEHTLSKIAGYVVGGSVLITGFTALRFILNMTVMPVVRIAMGIASIAWKAVAWLGTQLKTEFSMFRTKLASDGVAAAIGLSAKRAALFALKFAAVAAAIYGAYRLFKAIDEIFLNGAMSKFGQRIGEWLAKFDTLRKMLVSMGLLTEGATSTGPTSQRTANQTLSMLEGLKGRGMTSVGTEGGKRMALTREYAAARIRQSLQARGYSQDAISAQLAQLTPRLNQFAAATPEQLKQLQVYVNATLKVDGSKVANVTAAAQNETKERSGKKVDRNMQQRGISQTRR